MSNVIAINAAAQQVRSPLPVRHRMKCCWRALPRAAARRCMCSTPVITSGFTASCCAWCATPPMAEDLVSQVFLDVWRTASQFEGRSQVSTWLLSIARFKALTALRQRKHEDIDQEDVLEIADEADTPEASLDRSNTSADPARLRRQAVAGPSRDHQPGLLPREVGRRGRRRSSAFPRAR